MVKTGLVVLRSHSFSIDLHFIFQKNLHKLPSHQSTSVTIASGFYHKNYQRKDKIYVGSSYPCYGPGSALVCDDILSGLGVTCQTQGNRPNVFTDLSKFNGWIDGVVRASVFKDKRLLEKLVKKMQKDEVATDDRIVFFDDDGVDIESRVNDTEEEITVSSE